MAIEPMGSGQPVDQGPQQILRECEEETATAAAGEVPDLVQLYRDLVLTPGAGRQRSQGRRQLVTMMQEMLTTVDHDLWHRFPTAWTLVEDNVTARRPGWQPHSAMGALTRLEHLIWNVWDEPWKEEFTAIKPLTGYFQHQVSAHLLGAEALCEAMGFAQEADACLSLQAPDDTRMSHTGVVLLLGFAEFSIYQAIYDLVYKAGGTLLDVHQCRKHSVMSVEDCVKDVMDRYDSVVHKKAAVVKQLKDREKKTRHLWLRKSHSEDRNQVIHKDVKMKVYGFPSAPSSCDPIQAATHEPSPSLDRKTNASAPPSTERKWRPGVGSTADRKTRPSTVPSLERMPRTSVTCVTGDTGAKQQGVVMDTKPKNTSCVSSPTHSTTESKTSKMHHIMNKLNRIKPDLRSHTESPGTDAPTPLWTSEPLDGLPEPPTNVTLTQSPTEDAAYQAQRKDSSGCPSYWADPTFSTFKPPQ